MDRAIVNQHNLKLLDSITLSCEEIQLPLKAHHEVTTNLQYKADIEKDIVTLENLKQITAVIKKDIESDNIGASAELLLRIAANDFKNKLAMIPEKKSLRDRAIKALNEVHRNILRLA